MSVTMVYCGQTVGRIKVKLGVQVGLVPGHIVLHRDLAPPPPDGDPAFLYKKGGRASPNFRPISIVAKRLDGARCHLVRR